jgi:uncharacterized damage-inducible protein DinB
MKRTLFLALATAIVTIPVAAQAPAPAKAVQAPDAVSQSLKKTYDRVTRLLIASAEKMPEASYGFKPTPDVRSFGELVGHVANANYKYAAQIKGVKNPNDGNDFQKKTAKADLVKALKDAVAFCAPGYAEMTDAKAIEAMPVPAVKEGQTPPAPQIRLQALLSNIVQNEEHYGNFVTYLRMKGLVPPSSEPKK